MLEFDRPGTRGGRPRSLRSSLLVALLLLFAPSVAPAAVTFSISGVSTSDGSPISAITPVAGLQITIDITLHNDGASVLWLQSSVFDYDSSIVSFVSGTAAPTMFNITCLPGPTCVGGLTNTVPVDLVESAGRVQFANLLGTGPTTGSGAFDVGVDGQVGGPHARLVFELTGMEGAATFTFGPSVAHGESLIGADQSTNPASLVLFVMPEPSTALLLALGLAGLASSRREA